MFLICLAFSLCFSGGDSVNTGPDEGALVVGVCSCLNNLLSLCVLLGF